MQMAVLLLICTFVSFNCLASEEECPPKFRQLVSSVHRPGFEQSLALPQTGNSFRWAQAKGYVYLVVKLLRPPKPVDPRARKEAIQKVDAFFDEVIKGYPEATQEKLKTMYYQNANQVFTKDLYVKSLMMANWHHGKNGIQGFSVEFDESVKDAELIRKLFLIHECAVHIGQMDQRVGQVGAKQLAEEHGSQDGYVFTEMSAALAEKTVLSSIDFSVVEAETSKITDPIVRAGALAAFYLMNRMSPKDYVELMHRKEAWAPTPAQVREFLNPH
jgi:hypothetical protein